MSSPFIYEPNKKIDLNDLIVLTFTVDSGEDDVALNILEGWLEDEEYKKFFKDPNVAFNISPDLDQFNIKVFDSYIGVACFVGVMADDGDIIDGDWGKFIIRDDVITKFTYIGNEIEDVL